MEKSYQEVVALEGLFSHARHTLRNMAKEVPSGLFPFYVEGDSWSLCGKEEWVCGFFPGAMALAAKACGDPDLYLLARRKALSVISRAYDSSNHDLGFVFLFGAFEALDKHERLAWGVKAAESLLRRFVPPGYISVGYGNDEVLAIDTMANIGLLWWAWKKTGRRDFYRVALAHTETTAKYLVKEDGGVYHIARFEGGRFVRNESWQGKSPESVWSRGLAWAVLGFAMASFYTAREDIVRVALKTASYFERHLPADFIAPWDFSDPEGVRDSSASAIFAYGLFVLYLATGDERLLRVSRETVKSLVRKALGGKGILWLASFHVPQRRGVETSGSWGDYFLLKAASSLAR